MMVNTKGTNTAGLEWGGLWGSLCLPLHGIHLNDYIAIPIKYTQNGK